MPIRQRDGDASHHDAGLFDRAKPPYRVPSMASVRRLPPNGLVVASLFAGGGGSSTGYRMAGFRVAWANEFVREAAETYAANHPGAVLDRRDVRLVRGEDVLRACGGRLDVLDGSPPCQAFSTAGKREAGWGEVKSHADGSTQRSDDLFDEYVRILREARPRAFVAENVPGLILGAAKGYFKKVLRAMREAGYEVEARLLDAQWLGVPQQRQRLVFVGFRRDLGLRPAFPSPLPYRYTVADALPWVRRIRVSKLGWEAADRPARTVLVNDHSGSPTRFKQGKGYVEADCWLEGTAIGREWDKLGQGQQSSKFFSLVRAHLNRPSPTVTASAGGRGTAGVTHPTEKRKYSIAELKRICGFPDDYVLTGSRAQAWVRCGNSVPPVMMAAVAREVAKALGAAEAGPS